ncbi:MAG: hypothetical protein M0Z34_12125 [Nitrospiraceae bacterium]|nr:hypothetical protein [Nitrospiraceae bacterium]
MIFRRRLLTPLVAGALLAGGGTAFLATNSQPVSGEGVSNQVVDGYAISNIHYNVAVPPMPLVDVPPPPSHLSVVSVSFRATTTWNGELQAQQGFVRLDPPPAGPPFAWTGCAISAYPNSYTTDFTCTLNPAVPVNGPGPANQGWIDSLQIEVNQ